MAAAARAESVAVTAYDLERCQTRPKMLTYPRRRLGAAVQRGSVGVVSTGCKTIRSQISPSDGTHRTGSLSKLKWEKSCHRVP